MNNNSLGLSAVPSLLAAMDALTLEPDFSTFFRKAAMSVQSILGADGTALIMLDDTGQHFEYRLFEGSRQHLLGAFRGMRFASTQGIAGRTLRTKTSIFVSDYPADPDAMPSLISAGLKANLVIPLIAFDQVIGVLASSWFNDNQPQISPNALNLAERIASQIAVACHREQLEHRLRSLVDTDPLTQALNRHGVISRLDARLQRLREHHCSFALFFIDIDGLKTANDNWGHEVGDCLLRDAANRLKDAKRKSDDLGRLGGDEFLVIAECDEAGVEVLAKRFQQALRIHFGTGRKCGRLSGSIGVVLAPADGTDQISLLRKADAAMYRAKLDGGDRVYRASALVDVEPEKSISSVDIDGALDRNELCLWYQPIINLSNATVEGFEALLRWQKPSAEVITATPIVNAIESARGDIDYRVGNWVLNNAVAQIMEWQCQGVTASMHINISARHFLHPSFLAELQSVCELSADIGKSLLIEITETAMLEDLERARRIMLRCHDMGVRVAIDDFGTGYASLTYLKRLPLDVIKIDRSFVADLPHNKVDRDIIKGIVSIAHALGLQVVAEGAELCEQVQALHELGCDQVQGYVVHRPMPVSAVPAWLTDQQRDVVGGVKNGAVIYSAFPVAHESIPYRFESC